MISTVGARAWLIRHGQGESNAGMPVDGPGTAPLTPLGRAEAGRVAAAFTAPPALIVSSTFERARQTARPTRERFPDVPYQEWAVEEFTPLGSLYGPGSTNAERLPRALAYWERCDPAYAHGGDGESFDHLIDRAWALADRLARRPEGLVAVFTHAGFMRALMWSLTTGITDPDAGAMAAFRRFAQVRAIPNGTVLELHAGGTGPHDLHLVGGSIAHLTTTAPAAGPGRQPSGKPAK